MPLQYIHDTKGKATGVFIPIAEWKKFEKNYINLQLEESKPDFELQDWQKEIINERMANYEENPNDTISFNELMNRVKKSR